MAKETTDHIVSTDGRFTTYQQNDGMLVTYGPGGWVTGYGRVYVPPPPPPPPAPPPVGAVPALSIQGRLWMANGRPWVPKFADALAGLTTRPMDQLTLFADIQARGGNGVRVFAGALPWSSPAQTVGSALNALPGFLDRAAMYGLCVETVALTETGTGYNAKQHLSNVISVLRGRRGMLLEGLNEFGHPTQNPAITPAVVRAWCQELAPADLPWAVGAVNAELPPPYGGVGGPYNVVHLDRGRTRWNNVRRVREVFAVTEETGVPTLNNEPTGADEQDGSVTGKQRWSDPALFAVLGALDRAFATGGVHHSQSGLWGTMPEPVQRECASAYFDAYQAVDDRVQVASAYKNVNHTDSPLVSVKFWDGEYTPGAQGVVRAYSFITQSVGCVVLVGRRGNYEPEWGNGWIPASSGRRWISSVDGASCEVLQVRR